MTVFYSQRQAQLDLALMLGQITSEEYWEEVLRELSVSIEVRRLRGLYD